jgi:ribosomal-protein-serine acetyltransferase
MSGAIVRNRDQTSTPNFQASATAPHMLSIPSRAAVRKAPPESARIVLLPIEAGDGPELWETVDGSRWHLERWLPWVPFNNTPEASQRYAEACAADWDAGRAVRFCVRDRQSRQLLGVVGLDSCVHLHRSCELGYWLRLDATGRGLMTEAAQTCAEFALRRMSVHRIRCAAATDNYPSLRVISRLGFRFEGIARQAEFVGSRWLDHAVFARLSTDE